MHDVQKHTFLRQYSNIFLLLSYDVVKLFAVVKSRYGQTYSMSRSFPSWLSRIDPSFVYFVRGLRSKTYFRESTLVVNVYVFFLLSDYQKNFLFSSFHHYSLNNFTPNIDFFDKYIDTYRDSYRFKIDLELMQQPSLIILIIILFILSSFIIIVTLFVFFSF